MYQLFKKIEHSYFLIRLSRSTLPTYRSELQIRAQPLQDKQNQVQGEAFAFCAFDMFFTRNVPHITEKIFFTLGYESYKTCLEVSNEWYELLSSESYQTKAKSMFKHEILKDEEDLCNAARDGNIEEVTRLLSSGMLDINCVPGGYTTTTPLWQEAIYGSPLHRLLYMVLPSIIYRYKDSPLHNAAYWGHINIVELLLDNGAEVDIKNKYRNTPLHYAAWSGHREIVQLLLNAGAEQIYEPLW